MEQKVITDYLNKLSWNDLCKKYNISLYQLHKILKKNNIKVNRNLGFTENQKELLKKLYLENIECKEIANQLSCSLTTVRDYIKKLQLPLRGKGRKKDYTNVFLLNSKERDYWLGYIFADGHVDLKNGIVLISKDIESINNFQTFIQNQGNIYKKEYTTKKGSIEIIYNIVFLQKDLAKWFMKTYSIESNKSLTLNPSINLNIDIIRGYFDGDGSIKYQKGFNITSGSKIWLERIQNFFTQYYIKSKITKYKNSNCYKLVVYDKQNISKIYNLLYYENCLCLNRKKQIFETYRSNSI